MRGVLAPKFNKHLIVGAVITALFVVLLAIFTATVWNDTYSVSGRSMVPTFHDGERIKVEATEEPKANDVVIFEQQEQWPQYNADRHGHRVIKRIIGLKGDRISLSNNTLKVNGELVYTLPSGYECEVDSFEDEVPAGQLFVLGDNTENSRDSLRALCLGGQDPYVHMNDVHTWGTAKKVTILNAGSRGATK